MTKRFSKQRDNFAEQQLPPREQWPDFINLDRFAYPERLNCVEWLLDKAVEEGHGDRVCLYSGDSSWTYRALQVQVNRLANLLVEELALVPGERVLLVSPNSAMLVICWLAVIKAGGIAVASMPLLRANELSVIADKAQVRLALADERVRNTLEDVQKNSPCLQQVICFGLDELENLMADKADHFSAVNTAADDICLIAFTSGTTGSPKGTMHFHRDLLTINHTFSREILRPTPGDIFIGTPPLAFTFGLGALVIFPMLARAATVLLESPTPQRLCEAVEKYRATILFTAPTAYRNILADIDAYNLGSLKKTVSAGEPLPRITYDRWLEHTGIAMTDGLGATEMLHIFISARAEEVKPGSTGKPVPGYEAKIIDQQGNTLPSGEIGWLAVRGPTGCRYLNDKRQRDYVRNGWNITGDVYLMDAEGYFWFQARGDEMIVSSGYNISGVEVENALLMHPTVKEVAVVASPDEQRGSVVKAFVVTSGDIAEASELITALQEHCKQVIAPYKYPRKIEFMESLPKTATGKLQRSILRKKEQDR